MHESLPESVRSTVAEVLRQYSDVFSKSDNDLRVADAIMHKIDTGDAVQIRQPLETESGTVLLPWHWHGVSNGQRRRSADGSPDVGLPGRIPTYEDDGPLQYQERTLLLTGLLSQCEHDVLLHLKQRCHRQTLNTLPFSNTSTMSGPK